jgi:hypothetical protein
LVGGAIGVGLTCILALNYYRSQNIKSYKNSILEIKNNIKKPNKLSKKQEIALVNCKDLYSDKKNSSLTQLFKSLTQLCDQFNEYNATKEIHESIFVNIEKEANVLNKKYNNISKNYFSNDAYWLNTYDLNLLPQNSIFSHTINMCKAYIDFNKDLEIIEKFKNIKRFSKEPLYYDDNLNKISEAIKDNQKKITRNLLNLTKVKEIDLAKKVKEIINAYNDLKKVAKNDNISMKNFTYKLEEEFKIFQLNMYGEKMKQMKEKNNSTPYPFSNEMSDYLLKNYCNLNKNLDEYSKKGLSFLLDFFSYKLEKGKFKNFKEFSDVINNKKMIRAHLYNHNDCTILYEKQKLIEAYNTYITANECSAKFFDEEIAFLSEIATPKYASCINDELIKKFSNRLIELYKNKNQNNKDYLDTIILFLIEKLNAQKTTNDTICLKSTLQNLKKHP